MFETCSHSPLFAKLAQTRRLACGVAAALIASLLVLAPPQAAQASVVYETQAEFSWSAAPGSVLEYGVWVVPEGETPASTPSFRVSSPLAFVSGHFGEAVYIVVAAYYEGDVLGPFSTPSETLYFRAPIPAPFDANGDGRVDRTLRDVLTGDLRLQLVDGSSVLTDSYLLTANAQNLQVSGSVDFDGDGNSDLVLSNGQHDVAEVWLLEGEVVRDKLPIATLGSGWSPRATGDVDADGTVRLFWHNATTGDTQLWSMRNDQVVAQIPLLNMPSSWELSASCDLDGNGFRDFVWVDQAATAARIWLFDATGGVDELNLDHPGSRWWVGGCGDFERDGADTIVWQAARKLRLWSFEGIASSGTKAEGQMRGITLSNRHWLAQTGDFDADGDADMLFVAKSADSLTTRLFEADTVVSESQLDIAETGRWMVSSW